MKAGQLIAVIESEDLAAAHQAAEATVSSQQAKLNETIETERQTRGETSQPDGQRRSPGAGGEGGAGAGRRRTWNTSRPIRSAPWRWPSRES